MNFRTSKNIIVSFLFIIICHTAVYSQDNVQDLFPRTDLELYILESEFSEGNYLIQDMYELGFIKYDHKEVPKNRPNDDRMITLRS
ncbi:MAG: hypothetical protein KAQ75_06715, partial [Bacteroidales bacterium]|nr:hypothetical protein [Bacteroidales bacterium]